MSQFPSMPLFVGDMLADTEHLSNEEFGVYHRLLYAMWRHNGWVPDDDNDLARICHVWRRRWPYVKKRLLPFLVQEDGKLSEKNLLRIHERVALLRTKNVQNSAAALRVRSNKNKDITSPTGSPTRARDPKTKSKVLFNGSAAMAGSPAIGGRSPATPPEETLTADDIAAIKERLSWAH